MDEVIRKEAAYKEAIIILRKLNVPSKKDFNKRNADSSTKAK